MDQKDDTSQNNAPLRMKKKTKDKSIWTKREPVEHIFEMWYKKEMPAYNRPLKMCTRVKRISKTT